MTPTAHNMSTCADEWSHVTIKIYKQVCQLSQGPDN